MLRFIKNFTEDLSRRFNTTALDVAPQAFITDQINMIADIERPTEEYVRLSYSLFSYLVVNGQNDYWVYALAQTPGISPTTTQTDGWRYDLTKIQSIDLLSFNYHGSFTMGGGTGNVTIEKIIKTTGSNLGPDSTKSSYRVVNLVAPTTGTRVVYGRDDDVKRIYTGQTVLASGNLSFPNGPGSPIFIAPQFVISVPNTMPDLQVDELWVEVHLKITWNKAPRTVQDIAILPA